MLFQVRLMRWVVFRNDDERDKKLWLESVKELMLDVPEASQGEIHCAFDYVRLRQPFCALGITKRMKVRVARLET